MNNFDAAIKAMPRCIGGFDHLRHKTVSDLVFMVEFELDLYGDPNEESDIRTAKQAAACHKWLARFKEADKAEVA